MTRVRLLNCWVAAACVAVSTSSMAALVDRGGGLIYDDVLDVTWLQDANFAATSAPPPPDICFDEGGGEICFPGEPVRGRMTWEEAKAWVEGLSYEDTVRGVTWDDWRLPRVAPIDGVAFNNNNSTNASTDEGYAPTTTDGSDGGWRDTGGDAASEMGHMFYVNLANLGACSPQSGGCTLQDGRGLSNTGPFLNLAKGPDEFTNDYWTETPVGPAKAFYFNFKSGFQGRADTDAAIGTTPDQLFAWAVRDGDVSVVPLPAAVWSLGAALALLVAAQRRRS
ncbi:MAG: hypothetical protein WD928_09375 [Gammaproteobacteria bacterium]